MPKLLKWCWLDKDDFAKSYNKIANEYDENWLSYIKPHTFSLLQKIPKKIGTNQIIDLGCGTGFSLAYLEETYENEIFAVDISEKMIEEAEKKVKRTKFLCEDMLLFLKKRKKETASLIFSAWAIGYSNPKSVAKEAYRVLEKGGYFVFIVNTSNTLPKIFEVFKRTMYKYPSKIKKLMWPKFPKDFSFIDKKNYEKIYEEVGRVDINLENKEISEWVFKTGILAGFEEVMEMSFFKEELKKEKTELCHKHIIGIYRKK